MNLGSGKMSSESGKKYKKMYIFPYKCVACMGKIHVSFCKKVVKKHSKSVQIYKQNAKTYQNMVLKLVNHKPFSQQHLPDQLPNS